MSAKNFTVYKSSAGSGKTFTLVKEYLALALNDDTDPPQAYRHILAITFTNKAAAEMKERIIKALKELSAEDHSEISSGTKTLLTELKKHPELNRTKQLDDETIRKRAGNVLSTILHNYSDFAIGTIDSFVHKVVRTFAFDLKIPMAFDLEMDAEKLLTEAIDLLISKIGNDEKLTKILVEFTESKTDDEKSWHIENDLLSFARNLLNDEGAIHIEKLKLLCVDDFFVIRETLQKELKDFENNIINEAEKANEIIKSCGLSTTDFYYGKAGIGAYFEKLSKGIISYISPNTYVQATVGEDKWYTKTTGKQTQSAIDGIKTELLDCFLNIQTIKDAGYCDYVLFGLINKTIYSLAVLNEIEKLLEEYKAQNNILHISEFNKMIAKIVLNEPVPFIYERLGEKYNNYLIDEFQDTSVLQFQNLLPLIDNALANGNFTMLVGDGKQAIYRWRGGEVEQFSILPKVYSHNENPLLLEREEALIRNHNPQVLNKNYRSKREIIEFNNSIFKVLSDKLTIKYQKIYETLKQEFDPGKTGGFVQIEFTDKEKEEKREHYLERTFHLIEEVLADNYQLKDIAILVRKNSDGSDIANYLSQHAIPVISPDSLLLSNSREVNFLFSLIKLINDASDQIIQTEILEYLISSGRMERTINELLIEKNQLGFASLIKKKIHAFNTYQISRLPLYELCEELVRTFDLNEKANAYVQFFLDEVLNYSLKKNNNLTDFIEYWNEKRNKASLVVPQGMNAVSIMTIHRAKGLEFPVVIMPFADGKVEKGKKNLWIDLKNEKISNLTSALVPATEELKETPYGYLYEEEKNKSLLDNLNVVYVALTRPEERLYVLAGKPSKNPSGLNSWSDMFAYYFQSTAIWKEGESVYPTGAKSIHVRKTDSKEVVNFELKNFNSTNWRENIRMKATAPSGWNTELAQSKKEYGVMVHAALSRIRSAENIHAAVEAMVLEGLIPESAKEKLTGTILKIIQLPELKVYFESGLSIKNESGIIALDGELFRPDRVIINENKAVVIDYKTGGEKTVHKKQILEYADLLNQMGYTVSEKILVYIEEEKVVFC